MRAMLATVAVASLVAAAAPAFAQTCDPKYEKCDVCDPKYEICGADCSPGFYKNHLEAWCTGTRPIVGIDCPGGIPGATGTTFTCVELVGYLSAEVPFKATAEQRAAAKACLDAISPADICEEEERY